MTSGIMNQNDYSFLGSDKKSRRIVSKSPLNMLESQSLKNNEDTNTRKSAEQRIFPKMNLSKKDEKAYQYSSNFLNTSIVNEKDVDNPLQIRAMQSTFYKNNGKETIELNQENTKSSLNNSSIA